MRKQLLACACVLMAMTAQSAEPVATDADSIDAVWKPQSLVFNYRSEGRTYSCETLEYKIGAILRELGARDTLLLHPVHCHDLASMARFEVIMESPVAATDETVRELTHYDSRDELVARLQGLALPSANDLERFPATWSAISLRRASRLGLEAGDCALVQQLRQQILSVMSIRVTMDIKGVDCSQELTGITGPPLAVVALVPTGRSLK